MLHWSAQNLPDPFGYIIKPFSERDLRANIEIGLYKHKAESKLRSVERWLATTLNSVGDGVLSVDTSGAINFMNPEAESLTGWTAAEARGKFYSEVFSLVNEHSRASVQCPIEGALRDGLVVQLASGTMLAPQKWHRNRGG